MIKTKKIYTFFMLANLFVNSINAASVTAPGESTAEIGEGNKASTSAVTKDAIQKFACSLIDSMPLSEAKLIPEADWEALIIISADEFEIAERKEHIEDLMSEILEEIRAQLSAK